MPDDRTRGSRAGSAVRGGLIDELHEDDASRHELARHFPEFLRWIDSDPDRAWVGFYSFTWKLLQVYPPRLFQGLSRETREDIAMKIVLSARENDFRTLRKYRDEGKPFAAYVLQIATHAALDVLRKNGVAERKEVFLRTPMSRKIEDEFYYRELLSLVLQCIETLGERCQLLLLATAEEHKPGGIAALLGGAAGDGKKISESLRQCRRSLITCLRNRGFNPGLDGM